MRLGPQLHKRAARLRHDHRGGAVPVDVPGYGSDLKGVFVQLSIMDVCKGTFFE